MDFQDKLVHILFCLVSVLEVSSSQLKDLLLESLGDMSKPQQISEFIPVLEFFQTGPFESTEDRFYNSFYNAESEFDGNKEKIVSPERRNTGNQKIPKWNGNEESGKLNGNQVKWLTNLKLRCNVAKQLHKLNNQIKNLSKVLTNLKKEVSQMKMLKAVNSFGKSYEKMSLDNEIENNNDNYKSTINQVNNVSNNNQYRVGNTFIINIISEEKNSSLADTEILKELTDHKIEPLSEKAVNNLIDGEISPAKQSPHQEYESDLLKQVQNNFSNIFNHQNVTLEQIEQMSKIVDFVKRYHGVIGDLNFTAEWDKPKGRRNENLDDKKNYEKKVIKNMIEGGTGRRLG